MLYEMSVSNINFIPNKSTIFHFKMSKIWLMAGLPNLWTVNIHNNKNYIYIHRVTTLSILIFIILEITSFFKQLPLSDKQSNDQILFNFSHPILFTYYIGVEYYKTEIVELLSKLCMTLKNVYNDPEVEKSMIKKASFYSIVHFLSVIMSLSAYGIDALIQVIQSGRPFVPIVTVWPDIEENSPSANIVRFIIYIIWYIFIIRVSAIFILIITTTVILSHQYKNLQSYFYSLNDIFQNVADENHEEKEAKYIKALQTGIKLHSDTLWCARQCQETCSFVISGQIAVTVTAMCLLMLQMVNSERTVANTLTIISTSAAILITTGFLMWNAGDITIEAALVPTAMFFSGWHHCKGSTSKRVRKLLVIAMAQGQKQVYLRSFGVAEISYRSYLSIVKSSYSAFSLLY